MPLYFAYGSNMCSRRLEDRVGEVLIRGAAVLEGFRHGFDKRGTDGTGRGNVAPRSGASVRGVLYELDEAQLSLLDRFERGYRRLEVTVLAGGLRQPAVTYTALEAMRAPGLAVAREYFEHYLRGAREHGLPDEYLHRLVSEVDLVLP